MPKIDFWENYNEPGKEPGDDKLIREIDKIRFDAWMKANNLKPEETAWSAENFNKMEEWYLNLAESAMSKKEIPEETTVVIQNGRDEWWMEPSLCQKCGNEFMASNAKYCPYCGRKIVGVSNGKSTIYDFNEEEEVKDDQNR